MSGYMHDVCIKCICMYVCIEWQRIKCVWVLVESYLQHVNTQMSTGKSAYTYDNIRDP